MLFTTIVNFREMCEILVLAERIWIAMHLFLFVNDLRGVDRGVSRTLEVTL